MPHFRVDDMLHSHPKARRAGLAAMGLWAMCGSYGMSYKQDGFVPEWFVSGFPGSKKLSEILVSVGLWQPFVKDDEPGYIFHDWLDWQPSADEIERDRERQRVRSREFRRRLREGKKKGDEQ